MHRSSILRRRIEGHKVILIVLYHLSIIKFNVWIFLSIGISKVLLHRLAEVWHPHIRIHLLLVLILEQRLWEEGTRLIYKLWDWTLMWHYLHLFRFFCKVPRAISLIHRMLITNLLSLSIEVVNVLIIALSLLPWRWNWFD